MPSKHTASSKFRSRFDEMDREVERILKDFFVSKNPILMLSQSGWTPHIDVYETDSDYILKMEIAGVSPEDVHIHLDGRTLTITGHREDEVDNERRHFHLMEISYGRFSRRIELPSPLNGDQIRAVYNQGILRIEIPKAIESNNGPVHIPIEG
jgi:HSP20 family protein